MNRNFLWQGLNFQGEKQVGVSSMPSVTVLRQYLKEKGILRSSIHVIASRKTAYPLAGSEILTVLKSILLLYNSGVSIREALDLLPNQPGPVISRYIFCCLRDNLQAGESLKKGFSYLRPMFTDFFVTMIDLCEKTGKLADGLQMLSRFYQKEEAKRQELKKLTRYPKIVFSMSSLIAIGIIVFIVPMFGNLYSLYRGDLPIITTALIEVSTFLKRYGFTLMTGLICIAIWAKLPRIGRLNPINFLSALVGRVLVGKHDPIVYAHAMKMLLNSGLSVQKSTHLAASCMSDSNRRHGEQVTRKLLAGCSFSQAFAETPWFPDLFKDHIATAEASGTLTAGFEQIYLILTHKEEEQFNTWSKFIEPFLMLFLGGLILTLLLAVYLPIFDLGNRIG